MTVTLGTFRATALTREYIDKVLISGHISYGPLCGVFESRFAIAHGALYGVFTNSGTSSLQIALQAMKELYGWEDGDEVIVPALTFVATINIVYHCRLTPVLVDVDPDYYDIAADEIQEAVTPRTRAIIPVHLFGHPVQMSAIQFVAETYGLKVLYDACETMGVTVEGKKLGQWGDASAFSTYMAHIITTGVGGITITRDPDLHKRMRSLANHGIDMGQLPIGQHYDPTFLGRHFRFTSIGHSFRATELEAAIGLPQLDEMHSTISQRQANAMLLTELLEPLAGRVQLPRIRCEAEHAFMVYPIVLTGQRADAMRQYLAKHDIESRSMLPLTIQPCYSFCPEDYPVANWLQTNGFYVGIHQDLLPSQIEYMAEKLRGYFNGKI